MLLAERSSSIEVYVVVNVEDEVEVNVEDDVEVNVEVRVVVIASSQ